MGPRTLMAGVTSTMAQLYDDIGNEYITYYTVVY